MGNRPSFHKSDKRKKELARQKKKEDKKLRRLTRAASPETEGPGDHPEPTESGEETGTESSEETGKE